MPESFNPFVGPFAGDSGVGGNPLDDARNMGARCPKCGSNDFRAWTTDYGIMRRCLSNGCGEEWSGGTVAVCNNPMMELDASAFAEDMMAPDIDIPSVQFTGASHRDLSKTFGDDEW